MPCASCMTPIRRLLSCLLASMTFLSASACAAVPLKGRLLIFFCILPFLLEMYCILRITDMRKIHTVFIIAKSFQKYQC